MKLLIQLWVPKIILLFACLVSACAIGEGDALDSYFSSGELLFVAVNAEGFSYVSEDGKVWVKGGSTVEVRKAITYGRDIFMAVGVGAVYKNISASKDGFSWSGNLAPAGAGDFNDICFRP